jgi:signal transduction histidine kinase
MRFRAPRLSPRRLGLLSIAILGALATALVAYLAFVASRASPAAEWVLGATWLALAWGVVALSVKRLWLQNTRLEADLKASMADLAASRRRLVETADVERQRIERNLHDGAQQHLVGMRLRLELAAEAIREEPRRGEHMLTEIGEQMDETLDELRCLAQGVYPPLLPEHGLAEAIRSASRRSPFPGSVEARGIGRYPADTETAVYFCCLEALQNIAKHAGPHMSGSVRLWEEGRRLCFEVRDEGAGFAVEAMQPGSGLVNMRDRMEAAGGTLRVSSREGHGTSVRGSVPIASPVRAGAGITRGAGVAW